MTVGNQVKLVIEARGRAVADVRLGNHRVCAVFDHPGIAVTERLTPQLGHGEVEVDEVVRVEDDALPVALVEAHADPMTERLGHARSVAPLQAKLQQMGPSIRPSPYLPERMFPRLREQIGTALDLFVEFSTLGEYRLVAEAIPGASSAPADAPSQAPQLGGAGVHALRAAVRRTVAGGPTGSTPVATPAARRLMKAAEPGRRRRPALLRRPPPPDGRRGPHAACARAPQWWPSSSAWPFSGAALTTALRVARGRSAPARGVGEALFHCEMDG